jgi:G protein-coupled receptor Mth (Methuselah protein)
MVQYQFASPPIRLLMNLKLFIVMGISWVLEIVASFGSYDDYWWFLSDIFNLLQGVLIFAIFVLKKSVLVAIRKKLGKLSQHHISQSLAEERGGAA